jgi:hypothetical protein
MHPAGIDVDDPAERSYGWLGLAASGANDAVGDDLAAVGESYR